MTRVLVEIEPGKWRFVTPGPPPARSALPCPNVISDTIEPTEQVDGRFYTSKAAFRAVGRAHGLVEVGNEKPKRKVRSTADREAMSQARRQSFERAVARYKAGERPKRERRI